MKTIHVGLTGLSRAGKTVFLTCAIHNLIESTGRELREFSFNGWKYVGNSVSLPEESLAFPYRDHLEGFRKDPPCWPKRNTTDMSEFRIRLQFVNEDHRRREVELAFVNYAGERLIDVALLETSFEDWSDQTWKRLEAAATTSPIAQEFLSCVQSMETGLKGEISANRIEVAKKAFGAYCRIARAEGKPLAPVGPAFVTAAPAQEFSSPFIPINSEARQRLSSLRRAMSVEYDRYCRRSVSPFFKRIAACNHQIVLVDILDILRSGIQKYNEVQDQLQRILTCYRAVNRGWVQRLLSKLPFASPMIRKVTFCATKADQATGDCRENLSSLLRDMFVKAATQIAFHRAIIHKTEFLAFAAHRCTDDFDADHDGKALIALKGRLVGSEKEQLCFPGRVPQVWPQDEQQWKAFRFPDFVPRKLPPLADGKPLPHIKMDVLLYSLVEELL